MTVPQLAALHTDQALQGQMSSQEGCVLAETNCQYLFHIHQKMKNVSLSVFIVQNSDFRLLILLGWWSYLNLTDHCTDIGGFKSPSFIGMAPMP